ncbi:hypothetical protein ANN_26961 [Periplaneta americana]|uniref:DDE-1 domain-containing protein n=1 Tax=Periplaneta americana TaxID=6978 RepID=A0ABQ8RX00_PERAM|nr:hypothetical protein ANN_26961 [Periplaneta americana]
MMVTITVTTDRDVQMLRQFLQREIRRRDTDAQKNGIHHRFNAEAGMAGWDWLQCFRGRFPGLVMRKPQGLSIDRAIAINRSDIQGYFDLLFETLSSNQLLDKPGHIYNVDESGFQLNPRVEKVIADKGSPSVYQMTCGEKGETITTIACCNAEGYFLPPVCVFKGKNNKPEWEDALPNGSRFFMNDKSGYVNSNIFIDWLREHFNPRKPNGKVLLLLDGYISHITDSDMLELAETNGVILFCLPPLTSYSPWIAVSSSL